MMINKAKYLFLTLAVVLLLGCSSQTVAGTPTPLPLGTAIVLEDLDIKAGQTIFVPAYSNVHYASGDRMMELDVTLSIHNTDMTHPIIISSVRYYDTNGQMIQAYLPQARRLGPLASIDFFVDNQGQAGGVGTNFIVEWVAEYSVYEPVVETLMVNTSNTQGLSFTSPGRVIQQVDVE